MQKKLILIIATSVLIVGGLIGSYFVLFKSPAIRKCPDEWIYDKMLSTGNYSEENRQYFIIDGERKELKDYDLEWIQGNCSVEVQYVY